MALPMGTAIDLATLPAPASSSVLHCAGLPGCGCAVQRSWPGPESQTSSSRLGKRNPESRAQGLRARLWVSVSLLVWGVAGHRGGWAARWVH